MATNGDDGSESELTELQAKVKALKKKLKTCKSELHRLQKKLSKTEHQHKNTERYNEDLRKQVLPFKHRWFETMTMTFNYS